MVIRLCWLATMRVPSDSDRQSDGKMIDLDALVAELELG